MDTPQRTRGARFVDPQVLARIGSLDLLARTVVDGFINGLHKAPYLGVSINFAEHRGYMPGDDIRFIDWRVFARTDRFYVKQFEADTNTNFSVLLDISRSMSFGSKGVTKLDYGRYLAACLTYFCTKQRGPGWAGNLRQRHRCADTALGQAPRDGSARARPD